MNTMQFECLKVALKQDATGYVLTLRMHPDEIPESLMRDFVGARYAVAMVRLNDDDTPVPVDGFTQQAGIMCRDRLFHSFLNEVYGIEKTEKDAVEFLYGWCGINSRTELNGNKQAQENYEKLMKEYSEWREKDEPF
jgi:hypothetical protein